MLGMKSPGRLGPANDFGSRESLPGHIVCETTEDPVGGTKDGKKSKVRSLGGVLIDPPIVEYPDAAADPDMT